MEIKVIIVDDEQRGIIAMQTLLEKYCEQVIVAAVANDIIVAENKIREINPDVVFLDIEMPGGDGFKLLDKFEIIDFEVIFVTAFLEHAIRAIKASAIDYLLKPVNISELQQAIKKVQEVVLRKKRSQQGAVLQSANNFNPLKKLILTTVDGYYPVKLQEIAYCKANDSYTHFYMQNGKHYIASKSLKEFEEVLSGYNFFRIHKSFLINMDHIELVNKESGGISVIMDNQDTLPVAFRKKEEFIEKLRTM
jgi:two-component system LytT family response regulator